MVFTSRSFCRLLSSLTYMGERRILRDLDEWLNSVHPNLGKKRLPGLKELWKSGDLREKLVAVNAKISGIRTRWQVRRAVQVLEAEFADYHHDQMRLQVSTLVSTNIVLGRLDSVHTETTAQLQQLQQVPAMFQQVPAMFQQILAMLQQQEGPVRQRSRGVSMHSQVEPPGFNSQTTKVATIHSYRYILTGITLRSWPIQLHPPSPLPYYPLTPPFHMTVSGFASRNTVHSLPLTRIRSSFLRRMARPLSAGSKQTKWKTIWIGPNHYCGVLSNLVTTLRFSSYVIFVSSPRSWTS